MSELVPRLGEKWPPAFGKTTLGAGGKGLDKRRGLVKIPHGHAVSTWEKSATLLSLAPSTRRISGQASRAAPGRAWPLPGKGPALRAAQSA